MVDGIKLGAIYQHYKGNKYLVHSLVKHSETLDTLVLYECLYENAEGKLWVRPLKMFLEDVVMEGKKIKRFKLITDNS